MFHVATFVRFYIARCQLRLINCICFCMYVGVYVFILLVYRLFPHSFFNVAFFPSFRLFSCHCTPGNIIVFTRQNKKAEAKANANKKIISQHVFPFFVPIPELWFIWFDEKTSMEKNQCKKSKKKWKTNQRDGSKGRKKKYEVKRVKEI